MLLERGFDQAQGLRRMFAPGRPRVIQIVAGKRGVGRTTVAVHLALALARAGRDTLLVEAARESGAARAFEYLGLDAGLPFGTPPPRALEVPGVAGLALWPLDLAREARAPQPAIAVPATLPGRASAPDFVLVNSDCERALLWKAEHESHEILIVLSREPSAITSAYALVKRMCLQGMHRRFLVVVNRVASETEARLIFHNLARAAQGYLDVELQPCGYVPADAVLACPAAGGVSDAVLGVPAAAAFRHLATLLTRSKRPVAAAAAAAARTRPAAAIEPAPYAPQPV